MHDNNNETEFKILCYLVDFCKNEETFNPKYIITLPDDPKNINNVRLSKLILKNWQEDSIAEDNLMEIVEKIKSREFSNITMSLALSEYLHPISKTLENFNDENLSMNKLIDLSNIAESELFDLNVFLNENRINTTLLICTS